MKVTISITRENDLLTVFVSRFGIVQRVLEYPPEAKVKEVISDILALSEWTESHAGIELAERVLGQPIS